MAWSKKALSKSFGLPQCQIKYVFHEKVKFRTGLHLFMKKPNYLGRKEKAAQSIELPFIYLYSNQSFTLLAS